MLEVILLVKARVLRVRHGGPSLSMGMLSKVFSASLMSCLSAAATERPIGTQHPLTKRLLFAD